MQSTIDLEYTSVLSYDLQSIHTLNCGMQYFYLIHEREKRNWCDSHIVIGSF